MDSVVGQIPRSTERISSSSEILLKRIAIVVILVKYYEHVVTVEPTIFKIARKIYNVSVCGASVHTETDVVCEQMFLTRTVR